MSQNDGKFARARSVPVAALDKDILRAAFGLSTTQPITSTTLANIPGLSLSLRIGLYIVDAWLLIQSSASAVVGIGFGFSNASGNFVEGAMLSQQTSPTLQTTTGTQNIDVARVDASARAIESNSPASLQGVFQVLAAGTLTVRAQSSAGTLTILSGWLRAMEV
jgi:hypothetical protein